MFIGQNKQNFCNKAKIVSNYVAIGCKIIYSDKKLAILLFGEKNPGGKIKKNDIHSQKEGNSNSPILSFPTIKQGIQT